MQFQLVSQPPQDQSVLAAWRKGVSEASKHSPLKEQRLASQAPALLPRFAEHYQKLHALPRRMRRTLQR